MANKKERKEKTLVIVKPDGVQRKLIGEALKRFEQAGLDITHLEIKKIKKPAAHKFYGHLKKKLHPKLYSNIIEYITSGKVVLGLIEGENAAQRVRKIVGHTNPKQAEKGTIRADFGLEDMRITSKHNKPIRNIIHASESSHHAKREFKILKAQK
jgi:nucleoside-diphosphate kinase